MKIALLKLTRGLCPHRTPFRFESVGTQTEVDIWRGRWGK